ncbi:SDR family NAD(P)-dependent oxidoreductase [Phototrophicus methaneseepsis]|uniref:SDR family NAD(P)-dependent oxidoreductase n=1 Tax=Phototrophicus methaneseepsis TaxID=2710758 RepID=A0A7S8E7T9_9CHLR|nr:SDR family NAD(P)-dependent oxidoreductase [Phototrophicus methaneseepsis]QPC81939.1 SDR family NAD(P)-dependent oxidoreductase [Phototrophicus methaneseepsis]
MKIANKNIILTGAASGIGRALLDQLAAYPARILVVDVNIDALQAAVDAQANKPAQIRAFQANLMEQAGVDAVFEEALHWMGTVDLFIANAGFAYYEALAAADWSHIERIFQLNTFSPIYTAQRMRDLNEGRPYHMVIQASAMAKFNLPGYALYGATKSALDRFAEVYRYELPDHAHLTLVYPIATRTNFFKTANDGTPIPWPTQTPETVAKAMIRGIEQDQDQVYPSRFFRVGWIVAQVIPQLKTIYQRWQNVSFQRWINTPK